MAFLGTFAGRERMGMYNPKACYDLYDQMRSDAQIPEIEGDALNGALSIHQGMAGLGLGRQMLFCCECKRKLPPNTSIRNASRLVEPGNLLGSRRCGPCERAFAWTGTEVNSESTNSLVSSIAASKQGHRLWLAEGHADVCGNLACRAPRVLAANFRGWKTESRCMACFAHLTYYRKKGVPDENIKERHPTERELASRNFVWTVEQDAILLSAHNRGLKFREVCSKYFSELPAQAAKERFAVLSVKPRSVRKAATRQKPPDWTTNEIDVLNKAINEGTPASGILALLPLRTITSIGTKMSWLRRGQISRSNRIGITDSPSDDH